MLFMVDSCICIDIMRNKLPNAKTTIEQYGFNKFLIPSIVVGELWCGAYKSKKVSENISLLKRFLIPFEIATFDTSCAKKYGELRAYLEKNGTKIGNNDTLIAAQALSYECVIVTNNVKDFSRVPSLRIENWN